MKMLISAALIAATSLFAGAANAASTQEQIALCAAALDQNGVASASQYKPTFKDIRGGAMKKLTLLMKPTVDGKEPVKATCMIKRGEVVDVVIGK